MPDDHSATPPILDRTTFDSLAEVMAPDAVMTVVVEAAEDIGERLDRVAAMAARGEDALESAPASAEAEAELLAHDLAGLSGQVGLAAMAAAARELERAIRTGEELHIAAAADALIGLREESLGALSAAARRLILD